MARDSFDLTLAKTCAHSFSVASGIGCTVSDAEGKLLYECGFGCASCRVCSVAGKSPQLCTDAHIYGMTQAARFGGMYIYFCPMGLTCFVSPILVEETIAAKITVGPFLMVEKQDYLAFDAADHLHLDEESKALVGEELNKVPYVTADRVTEFSNLLFMSVGFLNNVSEANKIMETRGSVAMQGQITSYILELKKDPASVSSYPMETEEAFLRAVQQADREQAKRLLNELLGYIFFSTGGELSQIKTMVYDLLVLLCRSVIRAGADSGQIMKETHRYHTEINSIRSFDQMCQWMSRVTNTMMDSIFDFCGIRHADIVHRSIQYINAHYAERLSLEDVARQVYLSPSYFGKVFKEGTGESFSNYLTRVRIEHSKELLMYKNLRLTDIAQLTGFDDQSYFSRVFKRVVGVTPQRFRETKGNSV